MRNVPLNRNSEMQKVEKEWTKIEFISILSIYIEYIMFTK
jgi:hypothetical protein